MRGDIIMSSEEVKRLRLMEQVKAGVITLERVKEALEELQVKWGILMW